MMKMLKSIKIQFNIIIGIIFIECLFQNFSTTFAYFSWRADDPVADAYSGGEPDDYEKGIVGWNYDGNPIYKNGSSDKKKSTNYNDPIVDHVTNYSGSSGVNKYTTADGLQCILLLRLPMF